MRRSKQRFVRGLLIAGVVLGFGSGFHHMAHHRHHAADRLTRVCVDAALGHDTGPLGRRDYWVAQRCADHARGRAAP